MAELFTLDEAAAIAEIPPDTIRTALEKRVVTENLPRSLPATLPFGRARQRAPKGFECREKRVRH
jgi:hypothetical protein